MIAKVTRQLLRGVRDRRPIDPGVRILTYHGVVEKRIEPRLEEGFHLVEDFRAHLAVLRHCRVVPAQELDSALKARHVRPCVAITFDDGFRNNLVAAEMLAAAKLPATVFVASQSVERRETVWPTLLRLVLARGSVRSIQIDGAVFDLDRDKSSFSRVRAVFKQVSASKRMLLWAELLSQLRSGELDELVAAFPSIAMMSWSDVRALHSAGITIGSHGFLHELQHDTQPRELRLQELSASKAQIEAATDRHCDLFAFPNGTFTTNSSEEVRSCGYSFGFTMRAHAAGRFEDPMLLPRLVPGAGVEKLISTLVFGN